MAVVDDPKTLGRARLDFAKESDIDEFVAMLGKLERQEITPDEWRRFPQTSRACWWSGKWSMCARLWSPPRVLR